MIQLHSFKPTKLVFRSPVAATGKNWKKTGLQPVFLQPAVAIFTFGNKKTEKNQFQLVATATI